MTIKLSRDPADIDQRPDKVLIRAVDEAGVLIVDVSPPAWEELQKLDDPVGRVEQIIAGPWGPNQAPSSYEVDGVRHLQVIYQ